ncbi:Tetratricopeptide repeat protein 28 [Triticum urartu]|uniref:Tetratricopeptide repeat protein 28 n=1 Tax=Triticum urartu TaxID=4572 RepID=M7ZQZ2_TRIUA|nr:Tetratricopeptide repeat protein 28 [Triticum urartu]
MAASPVTLLHCDFHLGRPLLHVALRAALGLGLREKGIGGEGERIGTVRPEKVMEIDPLDATLFANRSLCWLRMREGDRALADAQRCKMLRPGWSKAWYREGSALSFMEDYQRAVDAFQEALRLDPDSSEIKKMLSFEVFRCFDAFHSCNLQ